METQREVQQESEWLSTEEVAARLSKTDRQVRRDCKEGRLVFRREGRKLLVDPASVAVLTQEKADPEAGESPAPVLPGGNGEAGSNVEAGAPENGHPAPEARGERQGGVQASRQELDRLFKEVRAVAEGHLRTERIFHAKLMEQVNTLERLVAFEHERNREVQAGLREILQQLGGRSVDVDKVTVDVRPRRAWWRRWVGK